MRDYTFADQNGSAQIQSEERKQGMFISHGTGFILVLLAICLAVLVGLVVHFASPGQLVCKCDNPQLLVPTVSPEELRGQCLKIIESGDSEMCTKCSEVTTTKDITSHPMTTGMVTTETTMSPTTTTMTTTPAPKINYRLPRAVKPYHYDLELQPEIYGTNSSLFTFNGSVVITLNVTESTSNITLHKKDIDINNETLTLRALDNLSRLAPRVVKTTYDEVRQFYVLHLDGNLDAGRSYEVGLVFHGKMRTDGSGLYLSSYTDDNNQTVYLATTQFEAPEARKAFPCFDEPALKATFDIVLVRKTTTGRNYRTLANTDAVNHEIRGDYTADIFARTPIMPTYLLAFIVCDFDQYENITSNITAHLKHTGSMLCGNVTRSVKRPGKKYGEFAICKVNTETESDSFKCSVGVKYRTLARPNGIQYADRAHHYGLKLFDWFEKTFDPDYPITKLDNIAIPDFVSGAMENWGLITYREAILYMPGITTASADSWTVEVVAHEIAHMWFGNIASPKWWWWLWLNEAFASYWDFKAVEAVYPERRSTEQFIVQAMHYTFVVDGSRTSHPLTNDAESIPEIDSIFDTITYSKGACIVRMMHFTMGTDMFIKGLNLYLTRHQYGSVEHQDLWDALTDQSTIEGQFINMTDVMDPWVTQMNFPLVTVKVVSAGVVNVRQERFLNNMNQNTTGDTAPYNYRWTIPITIASSADRSNFNKTYTYNDIKWLHHTETEKNFNDNVIPDPSVTDSWVIVNLHQTGFYRVNYEEQNWMALVKHLEMNHNDFPPVHRAQILNDAWSLQEMGLVKMEVALRTLNFLKHDTDYVPWRALARHIGYLDAMLERNELYGAFKEFMKTATTKTYNHHRMDIQGDTLPITIFQVARGSSYACKYGVPECVADSLSTFRNWMADTVNNSLDPNLIGVIICNAVRYGGMTEWNFAYNQYKNGARQAIKSNALLGMSCAKHPWLIERMLNMALDETKFKASEGRSLISYISVEPGAREITWNFVKDNYALLAANWTSSQIRKLISDVSYGYNTDYFLHELKLFANMTADVSVFASPIDRAIQSTQKNIKWINNHHGVIKDWLIEQGLADYLP